MPVDRIGNLIKNIAVLLAAAQITDLQLLTGLEYFVVEEPGVHAHNDRNLFPVSVPDFPYHMHQHLIDRIAVVRVFLSSTEHRVHHIPAPVHLQGLEPFDLLVCGLHPMALLGIVIVQNRRINAEHDHFRPGVLQAPEKHILQQSPEQVNPTEGDSPDKTLDGMRRSQSTGTEQAGIGIISGKMIEPVQMAARTIHEEAQNLHEHLGDRQALAILPHCTEQAVNNRKQPYVAQVQCEDAQTGPAGELVVARQKWRKSAVLFLPLIVLSFCHKSSPPAGLCFITW